MRFLRYILPTLAWLLLISACASNVCTSDAIAPGATAQCDENGLFDNFVLCKSDTECVALFSKYVTKGANIIAKCVAGSCHRGDNCSPNAPVPQCACGEQGPECKFKGVCVRGCDGKDTCHDVPCAK